VTPAKKHGVLGAPKKSAYSFERWQFDWERQYMEQLEEDADVFAWTKNHKIRIPYIDFQSRKREYRPDFLVKLATGKVELHEVKGGHLKHMPDTKRKLEAGRRWCAERGIEFVLVTKE
jgi:hypothetical protein